MNREQKTLLPFTLTFNDIIISSTIAKQGIRDGRKSIL